MIFSEKLEKASKGKGVKKELSRLGSVLMKVNAGAKTFPAKDMIPLRRLVEGKFIKPKRRFKTKTGHLRWEGYVLTNKGRAALRQFL